MIKNYIPKQTKVSAIKYTGNNAKEVREFCPGATMTSDGHVVIPVFQGTIKSKNPIDDYIVKFSDDYYTIIEGTLFEQLYKETK